MTGTRTASPADHEAERRRLEEARDGVPWRQWGPYLAERAWGTVREDYSASGDAWGAFTHDDARRRAYRWNEDGLLGISDDEQRLCLALGLWNERDPILKERLFGLSNPEGNHGEDVKELYFYLDAVPSSAYLRATYLYPQAAFPYADLVAENARRDGRAPEYELLDTGIIDDDRFFDVVVEYAKAAPDQVVMRIRATNHGPDPAPLHVMPTAWFRNTWSWDSIAVGVRPLLRRAGDEVLAEHPTLGRYRLAARAEGAETRWLFTENESSPEPGVTGDATAPVYSKDAFHRLLVDGDTGAANPAHRGTKSACDARWLVPAGETVEVTLAMAAEGSDVAPAQLLDEADALIRLRAREADEFHAALCWPTVTPAERLVQRQALAGILWSLQYYAYDVARWRAGDIVAPPPGHASSRNDDWGHVRAARVLSMPDTWEYPWFAAWDLAFQVVTLDLVDPDRAKSQLLALLDDRLLHPSGQIPGYEWEFSDTNPPLQAWAALRIYRRERAVTGRTDRAFLERVLHGLTLNFGWWVNRRDGSGKNLFEGGFLGLDNISILDRSAIEATGQVLEQADATGWMAFLALGLTEMSLELAVDEPVYGELAKHFLGRFVAIGEALSSIGGEGLWDPGEQFFFDLLRRPGEEPVSVKAFSVVGLIPLFATRALDPELLAAVPGFAAHLEQLATEHPTFFGECLCFAAPADSGRRLLAIVDEHRLMPILDRLLDEDRFWSDHGVRSVSRRHSRRDLPVDVTIDGVTSRVEYEPGETSTRIKGGNSNWRGPVWLPINYLLWYSLRQYARYYGDDLRHAYPSPDGPDSSLHEIADDLARRLISLYLPAADGTRPAMGPDSRWRDHPALRDRLLFYEYFHAETGSGLGASHQTGWTALVANLIDELHRPVAGLPR
ncbi:MAG: glucosidase [Candidatus Limnocylindrales bacterium]